MRRAQPRLKPEADFDDFAQATVDIISELYGNGGEVQRILAGAWSGALRMHARS